MKKQIWIPILIVVVIVVGILIFSSQKSEPTQPTEKKVIKIAVLAPLTGPNSFCGREMRVGSELALQKINEEYPDNKIELVFEDTQFSPKEALIVAQRLVSLEHIKILIGACNSSATLAVAPLAEENQVLLFTPISFAEAISEAGDYIFRSSPTAKEVASRAAEFIKDDLGKTKAATIYLNNDYGLSAADKFKEEFVKLGGKIVYEAANEAPESDFKTILLHLKDKGTEVVFLPNISRPTSLIIKQANELGIKLIYVATNTVERQDFLEGIVGLNEEIYFVSLINHSEDYIKANKELNKFSETLRQQHPDYILGTEKANSYDVVRLVAKIVIEKCGEDTQCIKEELYKTKDYKGATGIISINDKGDVEHQQIFVNKIEDGKLLPYK